MNDLVVLRTDVNGGRRQTRGRGLIRTGTDGHTGIYGLEGRMAADLCMDRSHIDRPRPYEQQGLWIGGGCGTYFRRPARFWCWLEGRCHDWRVNREGRQA